MDNNTNTLNHASDVPVSPEPETYPLDDAFIAVLAECRQQVQAVEATARGALLLYVKQHSLTGTWQVAENGRELVRPAETRFAK